MDDLIKKGILKEGRVEDKNIGNNKIFGVLLKAVFVIILQVALFFGAFVFSMILAYNSGTFSTRLPLYIIFLLIVLLPLTLVRSLIRERKYLIFSLMLVFSIFAGIQISIGLIGEFNQLKHEVGFKQEIIKQIKDSSIEYQKIQNEKEAVKIIGIDGNSLITDKDFRVILNDGMSFTSEMVDYLNKNILGHQFDIIVPEFKPNPSLDPAIYQEHGSHHYPIDLRDGKWFCSCDVDVNRTNLTSILDKIYKNNTLH